jgi:hypothetical protein
MKIAVITCLFAKWNVKVKACHNYTAKLIELNMAHAHRFINSLYSDIFARDVPFYYTGYSTSFSVLCMGRYYTHGKERFIPGVAHLPG